MLAALDIAFWNTHLAPRKAKAPTGDVSRLEHRIDAAAALLSHILAEPELGFVGLCEVNEDVIECLRSQVPREGWKWHALAESGGLGFGYDGSRMRWVGSAETFRFNAHGRTMNAGTRVDLDLEPESLPLSIILSHWPSRAFGDGEDGERRRCDCGVILRSVAHDARKHRLRVVLCGDFNDEPFSRSIHDWTTRDPTSAVAKNIIFNPSWAMLSGDLRNLDHPFGTATYAGDTTKWRTVDQLMVSPELLRGELTLVSVRRWDDTLVQNQPTLKKDRFDHVPISLRLEPRSVLP